MRFAIVELPHTLPYPEDPQSVEVARHWATRAAHVELLASLAAFDGWAVTMRPVDTAPYTDAGARRAVWSRRHRRDLEHPAQRSDEVLMVSSPFEPVFGSPASLRTGHVLTPLSLTRPRQWREWVLAQLGARPGTDQVLDFFTQERESALDDMLALEA